MIQCSCDGFRVSEPIRFSHGQFRFGVATRNHVLSVLNRKRSRQPVSILRSGPGAAWRGLGLASALGFRIQQAFCSVVLLPLRFVSTFFDSMRTDRVGVRLLPNVR